MVQITGEFADPNVDQAGDGEAALEEVVREVKTAINSGLLSAENLAADAFERFTPRNITISSPVPRPAYSGEILSIDMMSFREGVPAEVPMLFVGSTATNQWFPLGPTPLCLGDVWGDTISVPAPPTTVNFSHTPFLLYRTGTYRVGLTAEAVVISRNTTVPSPRGIDLLAAPWEMPWVAPKTVASVFGAASGDGSPVGNAISHVEWDSTLLGPTIQLQGRVSGFGVGLGATTWMFQGIRGWATPMFLWAET